jgi:hypothetical protein
MESHGFVQLGSGYTFGKGGLSMTNQNTPYDEYTTAHLNSEHIRKIKELEQELSAVTKEKIVLIAYQNQDPEDSQYTFPYWE